MLWDKIDALKGIAQILGMGVKEGLDARPIPPVTVNILQEPAPPRMIDSREVKDGSDITSQARTRLDSPARPEDT